MARIPCRAPGPEERFRGASPSASVLLSSIRETLFVCETPGPARFLTTLPWTLALSEWKTLGPKTHCSGGVGRRRDRFVCNSHRHRALLINQASLRCLAAGMALFSSNFSSRFLSLREEPMEKFTRKLKLQKLFFSHHSCGFTLLLCTGSLSAPDAAFPSPEGSLLPGGVSRASLNSGKRQCVFCSRHLPVSLPALGGAFPPSGLHGGLGAGGASPAPCPGKG